MAQRKESACQSRRNGFNPWVRKTPWRRKWQPTPVFQPGKSHGQRTWQATVHRGANSWTQLSNWTHRHTHTQKAALEMKLICYQVKRDRGSDKMLYVSLMVSTRDQESKKGTRELKTTRKQSMKWHSKPTAIRSCLQYKRTKFSSQNTQET